MSSHSLRSLVMTGLLLIACLVPVHGAEASRTGDPAADELIRLREERSKAIQELNRLNPLSEEYAPEHSRESQPAGIASDSLQDYRQLREVLSHPAVQWFLRLFRNPALADGLSRILNHPRRDILVYSQAALLMLTFVFRAWRLSKVQHWAKRIWTRTWVWGLYTLAAAFLVPTVVLGEVYVNILRGIFEVGFSG